MGDTEDGCWHFTMSQTTSTLLLDLGNIASWPPYLRGDTPALQTYLFRARFYSHRKTDAGEIDTWSGVNSHFSSSSGPPVSFSSGVSPLFSGRVAVRRPWRVERLGYSQHKGWTDNWSHN